VIHNVERQPRDFRQSPRPTSIGAADLPKHRHFRMARGSSAKSALQIALTQQALGAPSPGEVMSEISIHLSSAALLQRFASSG